MNSSRIIVFMLSYGVVFSAFGMHKVPVSRRLNYKNDSRQKVVMFYNEKDIIPYKVSGIFKEEHLNTFQVGAFVVSNQPVQNAINSAAENGKRVEISRGVHSANFTTDTYDSSVSINPCKDEHRKTVVGLHHSPTKSNVNNKQHSYFWNGSANFSNHVWCNAASNFEACLQLIGHDAVAEQAYYMLQSRSPEKKKKDIIKTSPKKISVYSSKHTNLNKSWACRLNNLAKRDGDGRCAYLRSMNLNDSCIAAAAIKAAQKGVKVYFILNSSALTCNGLPLIREMIEGGVNVSIFCDKNGSRIMHTKDCNIFNDKAGKPVAHIYGNSTGNFTDECDSQLNMALLIPSNENICSAAKADFERVLQECRSLEDALVWKEAKTKRANAAKAKKATEKKDEKENIQPKRKAGAEVKNKNANKKARITKK